MGIKCTIEVIAGRIEDANPDRIYPVINIGNSGRISSGMSKGIYAG